MVFSSFTFLAFFLPAVVVLYFLSRNALWRNAVLTLFSLVFYAWGEPRLVVLMLLSITVNYICARRMERSANAGGRKFWLLLGVVLSLGALFYYKYCAFAVNTVFSLLGLPARLESLALPIGISFYTFQILTYTVDVYRGKVPAQRSFLKLALYISFFPQLIAGPIVNYTYIEPQLSARSISPRTFHSGLCRYFLGLGKKVLIANMCGKLLDLLPLTGTLSVLGAWLGAAAFALQIYFDFSGYSDMAIGLGGMFGFRFTENFNYPYVSASVTEFWRRWHISLGAFFRDYVYIPLGGNRVSAGRHILNLMIVWALTGLWHGASWNFVVWGLYYGVLLIVEKYLLKRLLRSAPRFLLRPFTLVLVLMGWVLFYHESLPDGLAQLSAMFGLAGAPLTDPAGIFCLKQYLWVLALGVVASLPWRELLQSAVPQLLEGGRREFLGDVLKTLLASAVFLLSIVFLSGSGFNPFLYFRF